jgi:hypothetical protein
MPPRLHSPSIEPTLVSPWVALCSRAAFGSCRPTNRSSCPATRRVAGRERLRNAAPGGTQLARVVSFSVWRAVVAGSPLLSSIR